MASVQQVFLEYWPHFIFILTVAAAATAAIHAAMSKTDVRAAIGWVGIILFSPLFGAFLYLIAGVNRVRRDQISQLRDKSLKDYATRDDSPVEDVALHSAPHFRSLKTLGDAVSRFPLRGGNHIRVFSGGDEAYPAMLEAIETASRSIALQSYIFDNDTVGRQFAAALKRAHDRGVQVRVLIDAIGAKYSRPRIVPLLRRSGIRTALFMTNPLGLRMPYANLRSHRKILVVDGCVGFTGGMNIREGFVSSVAGDKMAGDTHFRLEGPVVLQLMSVFAQDWEFTTHEILTFDTWCCDVWKPPQPLVPARCIRSGPDRSMLSTHNMLLGAFAVAQSHIRIQSPYFLPDTVLLGALNTAARRGVTVDIVVPGKNNLRLVNYAMTAQLDQVIRSGCRVWRTRGNFNHSKLITIDGSWSYIGSSNLDPRSLRLNFELDVEIYSTELAGQLEKLIDREIANADAVTLDYLAGQHFLKRLRNKVIWLASPYL